MECQHNFDAMLDVDGVMSVSMHARHCSAVASSILQKAHAAACACACSVLHYHDPCLHTLSSFPHTLNTVAQWPQAQHTRDADSVLRTCQFVAHPTHTRRHVVMQQLPPRRSMSTIYLETHGTYGVRPLDAVYFSVRHLLAAPLA